MATAESRTLSITAKLFDQLTRPLNVIERAVTGFAKNATSSLKGAVTGFFDLKNVIAGAAAAYIGLQGLGTIKAIAEDAANMRTLAKATGDTTENLSELRTAFELGGVKVDNFDGLIRDLVKTQSEALGGNTKFAETFKALGISVAEIQSLGPAQLFERIAGGMEKFGSAQNRVLEFAKTLPRELQPVLPVLAQGLAKFQELVLQGRAVGATITEGEGAAATKLNQSIIELRTSLESVSRALIEAFGPQVAVLLQNLAKGIAANRGAFTDIAKGLAEFVASAVDGATRALIGFVGVIEKVRGSVGLGSLLDTKAIQEQIDILKRQLREIDELKTHASSNALQGVKSLQDIAKLNLPFEDRQKLVDAFFVSFDAQTASGRKQIAEDLVPHEDEIKAQLAKLQGSLGKGLADQLEEARARLVAQLHNAKDLVDQPQTPDQAAATVGLPSTDLWAQYAERFGASMQRISADAKRAGADAKKVNDSVFKTPQRQGPPIQPVKTLAQQQQELTFQQHLAGLAPQSSDRIRQLQDLDLKQQVLGFQQLREAGVITEEQLADATQKATDALARQRELLGGGDFFDGFNQGARDAIHEWTDLAKAGAEAGQTLVTNGLDGVTNALTEVALKTKSAKDAFRDLAKAVVADLVKIIAKLLVELTVQLAINALTGGASAGVGALTGGGGATFGFEKGGIMQGRMLGVQRFAGGGVARRPTLALFGEGRNAEAFVPLPDNRSIPVTLNGRGGGGGELHVHVHAIDSRDAAAFFVENQELLHSLWIDGVTHLPAMRGAVQGAAR